MKVFSLILLLGLCFTAFADEHEGKFEDIKAKMIERMDKGIAHMQETKACVTAATNKEQLKACRDKNKARRDEMKKEWKAKKEEKTKKK